jgi:futalosine hydrolase
MKILFVAATEFELHQFVENLDKIDREGSVVSSYKWHDLEIDLVITGLGMVFTTYCLTKVLKEKEYDLVINAGIAGSFSDELSIGTVVNVKSEQFSDLGIEEPGTFKTLFEVGFLEKNQFPFKDGKLLNPQNNGEFNLPDVNGISGSMSHGCPNTISKVIKEFSPDVESMEGGAVFYVCLQEKIPFLEIRAISNIVEARDTTKWDIPTALENLTDELFKILRTFAKIKQLS